MTKQEKSTLTSSNVHSAQTRDIVFPYFYLLKSKNYKHNKDNIKKKKKKASSKILIFKMLRLEQVCPNVCCYHYFKKIFLGRVKNVFL